MASARSCNVRQPLSVNSVPFCRRILKPLADAVKALYVPSQQWPAITVTTEPTNGNFNLAASLYSCKSDSALACWLCERAERGEEDREEESGSGSAGRGRGVPHSGKWAVGPEASRQTTAVTHCEAELGLQNPQFWWFLGYSHFYLIKMDSSTTTLTSPSRII